MNAVLKDPVQTLLSRAHIEIIKNPETSPYCGAIFLGDSTIVDDAAKCPTAYTNGRDKFYGRDFVKGFSLPEMIGLVLHENLHVILMHTHRLTKMTQTDPQLANAAADYVVNAIIMHINQRTNGWCKLPDGGLYDPKFKGWSVKEVFDLLHKGKERDQPPPPPGGSGAPQKGKDNEGNDNVRVNGKTYNLSPLDDHEPMHEAGKDKGDGKAEEDAAQLERDVSDAIEQGKLIAGKMGVKLPRAFTEAAAPIVDWRKELEEWVAEQCAGRTDMSWHKFNARRLHDDLFFPSTIDERVKELVLAIDTSGSIGQAQLSVVAQHMSLLCEQRQPSMVRVLWWDTEVHGEQVFHPDDYASIAKLLKPQGGGGTIVSCVPRYITREGIDAQGIIVFTDGYLEGDIKWDIDTPTLWLVEGNDRFDPPKGRLIRKD